MMQHCGGGRKGPRSPRTCRSSRRVDGRGCIFIGNNRQAIVSPTLALVVSEMRNVGYESE